MLSENVQVLNKYPECTVQQAANFPDSSAPAKAAQVKTNSQPVISLPFIFVGSLDFSTDTPYYFSFNTISRWQTFALKQPFILVSNSIKAKIC